MEKKLFNGFLLGVLLLPALLFSGCNEPSQPKCGVEIPEQKDETVHLVIEGVTVNGKPATDEELRAIGRKDVVHFNNKIDGEDLIQIEHNKVPRGRDLELKFHVKPNIYLKDFGYRYTQKQEYTRVEMNADSYQSNKPLALLEDPAGNIIQPVPTQDAVENVVYVTVDYTPITQKVDVEARLSISGSPGLFDSNGKDSVMMRGSCLFTVPGYSSNGYGPIDQGYDHFCLIYDLSAFDKDSRRWLDPFRNISGYKEHGVELSTYIRISGKLQNVARFEYGNGSDGRVFYDNVVAWRKIGSPFSFTDHSHKVQNMLIRSPYGKVRYKWTDHSASSASPSWMYSTDPIITRAAREIREHDGMFHYATNPKISCEVFGYFGSCRITAATINDIILNGTLFTFHCTNLRGDPLPKW